MGYGNWANSKIKKLDWIDIKLIKWSAVGFALLLAKIWPPLLGLEWYWYLLAGVLAMIRPLYKFFKK